MRGLFAAKGRITLLILASLLVSYAAYRPYLFRKESCEQPCKDPGRAVMEEHPSRGPTYRPLCQPLQLSLELAPGRPRAGDVYGLFYKLRLKNISCELIQSDITSLLYRPWSARNRNRGHGVYFRLWGPDGKELDFSDQAHLYSEYTPIIPYWTDTEAQPALRQQLHESEGTYWLNLRPGQEIVSNPSKLDPVCRSDSFGVAAYFGADTPEGRQAKRFVDAMDAQKCEEAKRRRGKPVPPEPPPGFRTFDQTKFPVPGTYKIQAVFQEHSLAEPIYPNVKSCPGPVRFALQFLNQFAPGKFFPYPWTEWRHYAILAESPVMEFEVTP